VSELLLYNQNVDLQLIKVKNKVFVMVDLVSRELK